jgi:hypothetical protein
MINQNVLDCKRVGGNWIKIIIPLPVGVSGIDFFTGGGFFI